MMPAAGNVEQSVRRNLVQRQSVVKSRVRRSAVQRQSVVKSRAVQRPLVVRSRVRRSAVQRRGVVKKRVPHNLVRRFAVSMMTVAPVRSRSTEANPVRPRPSSGRTFVGLSLRARRNTALRLGDIKIRVVRTLSSAGLIAVAVRSSSVRNRRARRGVVSSSVRPSAGGVRLLRRSSGRLVVARVHPSSGRIPVGLSRCLHRSVGLGVIAANRRSLLVTPGFVHILREWNRRMGS